MNSFLITFNITILIILLTSGPIFGAKQRTDVQRQNVPAHSLHQNKVRQAPAIPISMTCANLSNQNQQLKEQLHETLEFLSDLDCYSEPAASSATCVNLFHKQRVLEDRISENVAAANAQGC